MTERPPAPSPDERARTIAARGSASVLPPLPEAGVDQRVDRITPLLHHVHDDGSVTILVEEDQALVDRAPVTAMVELVDVAPVPLREPVRGLLWITGRLVAPADARARAVELARTRPDPRLLDLGHGVVMLCLRPLSMVVADADGTQPLHPARFAAAGVDPFCHQEAGWLRHLELSHTEVLHTLRRHLPERLRDGNVRPLGLDRYGLRLRVEAIEADHDVRLAFERPISSERELSAELRRLVGCPFLALSSGG